MKFGVLSESFRLPMKDAICEAAKLGLDGIQIYAVGNELNCGQVPPMVIHEIRDCMKDYGIEPSAVCGDLGGHGFTCKDENEKKLDLSRRIVDLSLELGSKIITTHIGVIPEDATCERYSVLHDACEKLANYAKRNGAVFAIETGPEKATTLRAFLDTLPDGIGVNMDPANLVMVTDDDPVKAVHTLDKYIVHTHAKDGRMLRPSDPISVYNFFAEGGIGDLRLEEYFFETPLGQGNVDFPGYLKALKQIRYCGYLTIEREVGVNPAEDIRCAHNYLKQLMEQNN